jgi:hypothetical protein
MRKQHKSETEGRGNKAAEDDGDARERVRRENAGGRSGRSGSSRCRRSSGRGTQLAAQPLKFIQDVILKNEPGTGRGGRIYFWEIAAGRNGPGRATTGRRIKKAD